MSSSIRVLRVMQEMGRIQQDPPPGILIFPNTSSPDSLSRLCAKLEGPPDTPYTGGIFTLEISIPDRYPFEPPSVRFVTPVYHPNIDDVGRICLDLLNMPPKGAWKPSINLATLLTSIRLLLSEPNPDDGLMGDITREFKSNHALFVRKAVSHTKKYARESNVEEDREDDPTPSSTSSSSSISTVETANIDNLKTDSSVVEKAASALSTICDTKESEYLMQDSCEPERKRINRSSSPSTLPSL